MLRLVAAAALATLIGGTALAQAPLISQPDVALKNFDIATLGPVLTELGIVWRKAVAKGEPYIAAKYRDLEFVITPEACRGDGKTNCRGAHMISMFRGAPFNQQTVNAFNARFAFTSSGLDPSGDAFISRYEICDYGEARGNLAISLAVFLNQAISFRKALAESPATVTAEGYSSDLSAATLNRASFAALGGTAAVHDESSLHEQAIDGAAERVHDLLRDADAPRNKIENIAR